MLFNRDEIDKLNQDRIRKMEKELEMLDDQLKELKVMNIKKPVMTEGYPYICRCESYRKKEDKEYL